MSHFRRLQENRRKIEKKEMFGLNKLTWKELMKLSVDDVIKLAKQYNIEFVGKMKTISLINKAQ